MSRAREAARLANKQILTVSTGNDKLGIGSTSPVTKLDVEGNITADDAFLRDANIVSVGVTNLSVSGVSTFTGNVSGIGTLETQHLNVTGVNTSFFSGNVGINTTLSREQGMGGIGEELVVYSENNVVVNLVSARTDANQSIGSIGFATFLQHNGQQQRAGSISCRVDGDMMIFAGNSDQGIRIDGQDGRVNLNYGGNEKVVTMSNGAQINGICSATEFTGDTITFTNLEKSNIFDDGELGFDSSQGLLLRRTQQGVSGATVTVLDGANVSAGSGMSITNLGSGDTGTGQIVFSVDLSSYAITSNQTLTLTSSTISIDATGHIKSGKGSGGVALSINDGYGNANVTFNHLAGVPEQIGNSLRIETNTDATSNPTFNFEGKAAPSTSALSLDTMMTLSATDGLTVSSNGGRINCGQIMFDDGNASLDDYEEGTWTPSYSATGLTITSYDQRNGGYVKIGNVVYIWGRLRTDGVSYSGGNSSNNVLVIGLPYRNINDSNYRGGLHINYANNFNYNDPVSGLMALNNTTIAIYGRDLDTMLNTLGGIHQLKNEDMSTGTNKNNIYFWGSYLTDQGN